MQKKMRASRRSMGMNYAIREITVPAAAAAARGMKMYNFNIGDPNKWDFETPEYFKETLRQAVDNTDNGYGDSQGNLDLRKAIVDREREKNGVSIDVKDIYVTAGVSECINVMMGAMIEPTGVAYNGLFVNGGGLRPGGHAAVFGAGPIGLAATQLLKTSGVAKLFVFESVPERMELAKACGADYVMDPTSFKSADDEAEWLMDMTHGRGISLFAECAGATKFTYPVMAKAIAIGGKTVQIGHTMGITPVDIFNWQWNAATIAGSNGQSGLGIYDDVAALMASGRIDMRKMISGRFNLEDIEEGFKIMSGKVLVSTEYPRLQK